MSSIERRAYLRYSVSVPVVLIDQNDREFQVATRDLSLGGMRIECDSILFHKILADGIQTAPSDLVMITAKFNNPKTNEEFLITSHVMGVLRLAESQFSIRLSFIDIKEIQQDQLQRLLNK